MFTVGLTGGIGSGKSTAADYFRRQGVLVVDLDELARAAVAPGSPALAAIAQRFGVQILAADGSLDRGALAALVFADPQERAWLEAQTHPRIRELCRAALAAEQARPAESRAPYAVLDAPLLAESGLASAVDRVLVVDCSPALQLERAVQRGPHSRERVRKIIANQASRTERNRLADDLVCNEGSLAQLYEKLVPLHAGYLELAQAQSGSRQ
ncbi:MAG: dephospho-CoA kinase [Cellvibrionales bacterium]|nr:dephospho-CoA kinase [Cellvibrionales bacterium]